MEKNFVSTANSAKIYDLWGHSHPSLVIFCFHHVAVIASHCIHLPVDEIMRETRMHFSQMQTTCLLNSMGYIKLEGI